MSPAVPIQPLPFGVERHAAKAPTADRELSASEKKEVERLKKLDADVRRHEEAHLRAAGRYGIGAPQYEYQEGPDGKRYAKSGHVEIDTAEVRGDPQATLEKARVVKRAALAPRDPSAQDRKVAREAEAMAQKAERELREQKAKEAAEAAGKRGGGEATVWPPAQGYNRRGGAVFGLTPPAFIDAQV